MRWVGEQRIYPVQKDGQIEEKVAAEKEEEDEDDDVVDRSSSEQC